MLETIRKHLLENNITDFWIKSDGHGGDELARYRNAGDPGRYQGAESKEYIIIDDTMLCFYNRPASTYESKLEFEVDLNDPKALDKLIRFVKDFK